MLGNPQIWPSFHPGAPQRSGSRSVYGLGPHSRRMPNYRVVPKIRDTFLGVPIIRTIVFWGLYWGPLILGNYLIGFRVKEIPRISSQVVAYGA